MKSEMRVLLTGGGTAGHINPAIAIAQEIKKQEPSSEILFVGTPGGMEATLVKKAGFAFSSVEVQGIHRKLTAFFSFEKLSEAAPRILIHFQRERNLFFRKIRKIRAV